MNIKTYSACTWMYPDDPTDRNDKEIVLHAARGGSAAFQILTDQCAESEMDFNVFWSGAFGVKTKIYQLLPVCVDQNSGKETFTGPYEAVKEYATKEAPFYVFDAMREPVNGKLQKGRIALFVRLEAEKDTQEGKRSIELKIKAGEETAELKVGLTIHKAEIPSLPAATFGMVNWLNIDEMKWQHNTDETDERFDRLLSNYIDNQLEMRNTHLQIPSGEPVKDENGKIVAFDFSLAEKVGNRALERGFNYIMGGFVARFNVWDEPEQFLLWDRVVSIESHEGYRQLKLYFEGAYRVMKKNGWEGKYMQTLVDEPQFPNSSSYRVLCAIARKYLPGVIIHDPVESTHLEGGVDIWDVKQAVFEKYMDEFKSLQALDEEMWLYTCGFPAGKMMNRVLDLPLTASLLPMWMCYLYDCKGFLHWGYNVHTAKPFEKTCYCQDLSRPELALPPGNAHIVYPGEYGPLWSVRAQLQRIGAEDYELLKLLEKKNSVLPKETVRKVCTTFSDYTFDGEMVDKVRNEILEMLD